MEETNSGLRCYFNEQLGSAVDEIIIRLNIRHFRKLLAKDIEASQRRTVLQLLAEEEAKLTALAAGPKK